MRIKNKGFRIIVRFNKAKIRKKFDDDKAIRKSK